MDNRQRSKFDMYQLLKAYLLSVAPAIFLLMPPFTAWFNEFTDAMTQLIAAINKQEINRLGYAVYKKNVRAILSDAASDLAATLMLYATVKDKPKLYELANYKNAALRRFNEAQFISVTKVINELAIENLPELAPYGIDAASLIIYSQKIETFVVAKTQPRDEIYNKKEATATIKETFKTMDLLLKNMDKAVRTLLRSQTIFNNRYFARRKLIDPPTKMLALRAQAIDQDGNPIPFVKITCLKLKLNRKTSINGRFSIRIAPPGKYKITCHRPGFQPLTKYITIADGVRTELKIELLPIHSENSLVRIIE